VAAALLLLGAPLAGALEVPALPPGALLAAALPAGVEPLAAGADGDDGVAAGLPGAAAAVVGVADELSALGVDASVLGAGEAAWVLSAFFEASLEDPPEQATPNMASVLNRAT
jgi:hypothetical protein